MTNGLNAQEANLLLNLIGNVKVIDLGADAVLVVELLRSSAGKLQAITSASPDEILEIGNEKANAAAN